MCSHKNPLDEAIQMRTQYTFMLKKIKKVSLSCLLTWLHSKPSMARTTPVSKFLVAPKVFEPLKFDCNLVQR